RAIAGMEGMFRDEWPTSADVYLPVPGERELFRNPELAATYRRVVEEAEARGGSREAEIDAARDAFYRGFVAEALVRFSRERGLMDSPGQRHPGLLSADDLAGWEETVERPLSIDYAGLTVGKASTSRQAPVFLHRRR